MAYLRFILFPFAWVYAVIILIRNFLYDTHLLKQNQMSVNTLVIGNLCMGGAGKTPHTEYLIRLLSGNHKIAVLSRGYGRKTKGYLEVLSEHTSYHVGDEPKQIKNKFPQLNVFVCENRVDGVNQLINHYADTHVVLLDDAFQHRSLKPGYSILLTDYYNLYVDDYILPVGNLREFRSGAKRADIIIVTKSPIVLSPIIRRYVISKLNPLPHQQVLFSYIRYGTILPFDTTQNVFSPSCTVALIFAGIANIYPFEDHVKRIISTVHTIKFSDHHEYSVADFEKLKKEFGRLMSSNKIIITTEKDYMRLKKPQFEPFLKSLPLYYIPIEIAFHGNDGEQFNEKVFRYLKG